MKIWEWFQKRVLGRSDIYFGSSRYMKRWLFGSTSGLGFRVHVIERSDADRELHDHPFWFISLIIRGGYYEHTLDGRQVWYGPGSILFRSADTLHRLELERKLSPAMVWSDKPAITLVLRGRYKRRWGFLANGDWQTWQKFVGEKRGADALETTPYRASTSL